MEATDDANPGHATHAGLDAVPKGARVSNAAHAPRGDESRKARPDGRKRLAPGKALPARGAHEARTQAHQNGRPVVETTAQEQ